MGLISDFRKYKKQKEMLSFLEDEYGITKDDLMNLHEMVQEHKNREIKQVVVREPLDEKTKQEIENSMKNKTTPEQLLELFAGETEDFYPYGRPKTNNNN